MICTCAALAKSVKVSAMSERIFILLTVINAVSADEKKADNKSKTIRTNKSVISELLNFDSP